MTTAFYQPFSTNARRLNCVSLSRPGRIHSLDLGLAPTIGWLILSKSLNPCVSNDLTCKLQPTVHLPPSVRI